MVKELYFVLPRIKVCNILVFIEIKTLKQAYSCFSGAVIGKNLVVKNPPLSRVKYVSIHVIPTKNTPQCLQLNIL